MSERCRFCLQPSGLNWPTCCGHIPICFHCAQALGNAVTLGTPRARASPELHENDVEEESGDYIRDADGNLLELISTIGTWYYTLGISGNPLRYEYDHGSNGSIDRVGTYHYDDDADPDGKLMYLFSRDRP